MTRRELIALLGSTAVAWPLGDVLIGAGSLAAVSTPAITQGLRQLKMVTDWPAGSPGLQSSASRLAQRISAASAGRINIEMYPAGTLVRSFETFDAVAAGVADMYHSAHIRHIQRDDNVILAGRHIGGE